MFLFIIYLLETNISRYKLTNDYIRDLKSVHNKNNIINFNPNCNSPKNNDEVTYCFELSKYKSDKYNEKVNIGISIFTCIGAIGAALIALSQFRMNFVFFREEMRLTKAFEINSNRAYVGISNGLIKNALTNKPEIQFTLYNYGNTPAQNVEITGDYIIRSGDDETTNFDYIEPRNSTLNIGTLDPNQSYIVTLEFNVNIDHARYFIKQISVIGQIQYIDIYHVSRFRNFDLKNIYNSKMIKNNKEIFLSYTPNNNFMGDVN